MDYYTKDGRIFNYNLDNMHYIGGSQGKVYLINSDVCFKEYKKDNRSESIFDDAGTRFEQEMFEYFKNSYNDTNMGELYDLYYDEEFITVVGYTLVGYTLKYYQEMLDNILNMPISYIIDNFSLMYDLVLKLTDDCIRIVDLHSGNIINTTDGMVIIDYDKYYFDKESSKDRLNYINKSALMFAFVDMFKKSLKKIGIDVENNMELKNRILSLFSVGTTPLVLKYKLRSYDCAFDYIKDIKTL